MQSTSWIICVDKMLSARGKCSFFQFYNLLPNVSVLCSLHLGALSWACMVQRRRKAKESLREERIARGLPIMLLCTYYMSIKHRERRESWYLFLDDHTALVGIESKGSASHGA